MSKIFLMLATALLLVGCGTIQVDITHNYNISGDNNKVTANTAANSRPATTTTTDTNASIPASVLP